MNTDCQEVQETDIEEFVPFFDSFEAEYTAATTSKHRQALAKELATVIEGFIDLLQIENAENVYHDDQGACERQQIRGLSDNWPALPEFVAATLLQYVLWRAEERWPELTSGQQSVMAALKPNIQAMVERLQVDAVPLYLKLEQNPPE